MEKLVDVQADIQLHVTVVQKKMKVSKETLQTYYEAELKNEPPHRLLRMMVANFGHEHTHTIIDWLEDNIREAHLPNYTKGSDA